MNPSTTSVLVVCSACQGISVGSTSWRLFWMSWSNSWHLSHSWFDPVVLSCQVPVQACFFVFSVRGGEIVVEDMLVRLGLTVGSHVFGPSAEEGVWGVQRRQQFQVLGPQVQVGIFLLLGFPLALPLFYHHVAALTNTLDPLDRARVQFVGRGPVEFVVALMNSSFQISLFCVVMPSVALVISTEGLGETFFLKVSDSIFQIDHLFGRNEVKWRFHRKSFIVWLWWKHFKTSWKRWIRGLCQCFANWPSFGS